MTYSVTMLPMGRADVPGPELFWMSDFGQWHPLLFQVALIQGDGVTALVNTGPARDLEPMNRRWVTVLGERAPMSREPGEYVVDALAAHDLTPNDITHVLLTPLQLYTVSNIALFTSAQICLSRRGWAHFHTTHTHPHDDRATSIPDEILIHLVTEAWPRVRLLDSADEIAPGLRTWDCGVHHRASMVVEVDLPGGTAAISDSYFYLENVMNDHPIGICESIAEAVTTYGRVRTEADVIVPLYDPKNLDRFPDGVVRVESS